MNKQKTLIFSLSAMLFIALAFIVYSWTEPTSMPSSYSAPINTGTDRQYKFGEIGATRFLDTDGDYYINPSGDSVVSGRISMADPLGNDHGATKGYVDDLFGNIIEQEEVSISNLIYVGGVNPVCPTNSILLLKRWHPKTCTAGDNQTCPTRIRSCTTADGWGETAPFCYYCITNDTCDADTWDGVICAKGGTPLHGGNHTEEQCESWNGEVVTLENGARICKFNSGTCPNGWNQYENWSTTIPATAPIESIEWQTWITPVYTGSHNWGNVEQENFYCHYLNSQKTTCYKGYNNSYGGLDVYATITQIGCY